MQTFIWDQNNINQSSSEKNMLYSKNGNECWPLGQWPYIKIKYNIKTLDKTFHLSNNVDSTSTDKLNRYTF